MGSNPKYAMITFPADDDGLHDWYKSLCNGRKAAQVGREVFEVARLFNGSLTQAQKAARALAEMRRLFGPDWENEVKRFEKATREV